MITELIALTAVGMLCASTAACAEPTHWYIPHMGADSCVPLADVTEDIVDRAYYGAGAGFKTPEDMLNTMLHNKKFGVAKYELDAQRSTEHVRQYTMYSNDGRKMNMGFIDNLDECKAVMSKMEK